MVNATGVVPEEQRGTTLLAGRVLRRFKQVAGESDEPGDGRWLSHSRAILNTNVTNWANGANKSGKIRGVRLFALFAFQNGPSVKRLQEGELVIEFKRRGEGALGFNEASEIDADEFDLGG